MIRSNSKLNRRKSRSSTDHKPVHIPVDPEVSRQQAEAAAIYAFNRAQERGSDNMGNGTTYQPHHNKSQSHDYSRRQDENRPSRPASSAGESSAGAMKRQRSVRFVGSKAEGQKPLAPKLTQTNLHTLQRKPSTGSLRPRGRGEAITNDAAVPAAYRPPSRNSSLGRVPDCSPGNTNNYAAALAAYDEHYIREDDLASDPSSYRKIRRSKSLLHNNGTGVGFYNGTPDSSRPASSNSRLGGVRSSAPQGPRAMKSMSFLQPSRLRTSTGTDGYDVDVQIARDKFLRQVEQQRLASQPSFLFRSRKNRSEDNKEMRRSMRRPSSETNSYGMPISSAGAVVVTATQNASMRTKARKASRKFGSKIRSLFKRGSSEEPGLPEQQVESNRTHISDYQVQIGPPSSIHDEFQDVIHPRDDPNLLASAARLPTLHNVASHQQLRSLAGSMQSMRSETSTQSRLTSWGTTATDSTQAQQARWAAEERARQRLSIINENGTHKASSSFARATLKNQFSPYPSFHYPGSIGSAALSPVQSLVSPGASPQGQITSPVDSARVYSALMKRLDETSPQAKLRERASKASLMSRASLIEPPSVPPRRSSFGATPTPQSTPATIKSVPHENEAPLPVRESPSHHDLLREFGPPPPAIGNDDGSVGYKTAQYALRNRSSSDTTTIISKTRAEKAEKQQVNYRAFPPPVMGDMPTDLSLTPQQLVRLSLTPKDLLNLTPQQVANALEPTIPGNKGLRETKSTFFGSRDIQNIGRVASPYRRAVAEAELRDSLILLSSEEYNGSAETLSFSPELRASRQWPMMQSMSTSQEEPEVLKESPDTSREAGDSEPEVSTPYKSKVKSIPGSKESVDTGSIYSRATTGDTPPRQSIAEIEQEAQDDIEEDSTYVPGKHGSMILLDHSTYPSRVSKSHHRSSSSGASVDWKAWMKGEVEMLGAKGRHSLERTTSVVRGVLPKKSTASVASHMSDATIRPSGTESTGWRSSLERTKSGHVREGAQIHGDDTSIGPGAGRSRRGFYHKPQQQPMGVAQTQLLVQQRGASHIPKPVLKQKASVGSFNLDLHSFPSPPNQLPPPPPSPAPLPLYFGKEERRHRRSSSVAGSAAKKSLTTERPALKAAMSMGIDRTLTPQNTPQPLSERAVSSSKSNVRHGRSASAHVAQSSGEKGNGLGKKASAQTIRPVDWELGPGFPQSQGPSPVPPNSGRETPVVNKLTKKSENNGRRTSGVGSLRSRSRTYTPSPGMNITMGGETGIRKMVQETWGSAGRRIESGQVPQRDISMSKPVEFDGLSPMMAGGLRGNENWIPGRVGGERYGDGSVGQGNLTERGGGAAGAGKEEKESKMGAGSRRMVDMFLSSRRRAVKGSEDSAFI